MSNLSEILDGTNITVKKVPSSELSVKLVEMGIMKGTVIKVLYRAPFGDPIAVDVNGYVLALRKDEARMIEVEKSVAE